MKKTYTPMMMQYLAIKERHPDTLILFRLGDFYELFFDDAKVASKQLQLVLTSRSAGNNHKVPMCGVPHHAINSYIHKLINKGFKVGIVEQLSEASQAKGLVDRDVIQIMSPGAFIDNQAIDNNFILAIDDNQSHYSLVAIDISTGEIKVNNVEHDVNSLLSEIDRYGSKEVVLKNDFDKQIIAYLKENLSILISYEDEDFVSIEMEPLLINISDGLQMHAIARLIHHLEKTQKRSLTYLKAAQIIKAKEILKIDAFSQANLELIESMRNQEKYGSLFWLIDETKTSMGTRRLKQSIMTPSADLETIVKRQDMISALIAAYMVKGDLGKLLDNIYDLERLIVRISYGNANGRDLLQLAQSLQKVPQVIKKIAQVEHQHWKNLAQSIDAMDDLYQLLDRAIAPDCPITIKDGGLFKKGYQAELDQLIDLASGSQMWIAQLEAQEKEKTGIKNLKVGYNKVFGYYIEISQGNIALVKPEFGYIRKQTLKTGERYITEALKEKEGQILHAEERRQALEYELFVALRNQIATHTRRIQTLADQLADIDVLLSLANLSEKHGFVRPTFNDGQTLSIVEGRHPVIERVMKVNRYVANDVQFDQLTDILLITGPNMGGKSTYMRQVALIVILAQMGCYVPAKKADLPIFDQIFTRIGASDDLVSGQSTFMVEMLETNHALRHATSKSLLLFDEIGRGTATYDGMALAQAIIEYIASILKAKTIFSTHYHELTHLESSLTNLKNIQVLATEKDEKVIFLYKVAPGAMNKSYGINVARLAHLPDSLIERAKMILASFEDNNVITQTGPTLKEIIKQPEYIKELESLNPLEMTPLEALKFLYDLKKKM